MSADGPCDDHTPDTATLVGSAATISSLPLCSRGDRLRNEMAHPPGAMTVLKLAALSRAAVVIPLFGKLRRHSANIAALIHQWRITERTPQMRRRGGRHQKQQSWRESGAQLRVRHGTVVSLKLKHP